MNQDNTNPYNILNWGDGYFNVNAQGNIEVFNPLHEKNIELQSIVQAARKAGLQLPILMRFAHILQDRVKRIYDGFAEAAQETNYKGQYQLIYPIKVNQEYAVVREILSTPDKVVGLEAGSKPELMAVIGLLSKQPSTIICNGYKDKAYIRAALIAQQMGHKVFLILEKLSELDIILQEAALLNIRPHLGVRIRLTTKSAGKWENSGGSKSKFGLNAEQIISLIQKLKTHNMLESLQLIHCHLGSQIANIRDIRSCMQEVARYYVDLRNLGVPIGIVDVGGGLGIDYEGTHSINDCSINYSIKEYAINIMLALSHVCEENQIPVPNLISESGRGITAQHAVLVTNIIDHEIIAKTDSLPAIDEQDSHVIHDIWDTYQSLTKDDPVALYHYAAHSLNEAHSMFKHGVINLQDKAKVEQFYTQICLEVSRRLDENNPSEKELLVLIHTQLAAKLFCNLSFFQSIPDAWAIGQIFPVAPLTQLNEPLVMPSILQDLTCDSDGTLKLYTGGAQLSSTLLLPAYDAKRPYALGIFLVGAYQEILGNLHNLFGDTNSLDVKLTAQGEVELNDLIVGDTITNVLNLAHFDTKRLAQSYEKQLRNTDLSEEQIEFYLTELRSYFSHLTYLT